MSITEEIKARLDIVSYIQQSVPLKKAGRHYKANCPFHAENTPSFVVNPDTQSWRCFGACAEGGDIFNFAMKQHGWSFSEALEALGKQAGVEVRKRSPLEKQKDERVDMLRGLMQTAADLYHGQLVNAQSEDAQSTLVYVHEKRGFNDETIRDWSIGYAAAGWQTMLDQLLNLGYAQSDIIDVGLAIKNDNGRVYDRFRNRLMIPIRDDRGRVIGFGARALDPEDNPKYMNSPQTTLFDKSHVLFGLDVAKQSIRDGEVAVIVEGYMDVIQAHQAGFTNVVAQMGTALTETQLKMLVPRYAKKIVMALDSDAAGQNATRRSLETARQTLEADYAGRLAVDIRILQIPGAKDPDDLIRETPHQWESLVMKALPVAEFVIDMEAAALPENATIQERESVARQILPILTASESDLYKQDNIQKLALRLHISERDLMQWASEQPKSQGNKQSAQVVDPSMPPPLRDSDLEPPPELFDEGDYYPGENVGGGESVIPTVTPVKQVKALEERCLQILIAMPELFNHLNRKLRELAGGNLLLRQNPLSDFSVDDFTRSDYRIVMQTFISALNQHQMEVVDYLRANLDPVVLQEMDDLLVDSSEHIRRRLKAGWSSDLQAVWKQLKRFAPDDLDGREMMIKALELRKERLRRELDECRFEQLEAQQLKDIERVESLGGTIHVLTQARQLIEAELTEQQKQFTH